MHSCWLYYTFLDITVCSHFDFCSRFIGIPTGPELWLWHLFLLARTITNVPFQHAVQTSTPSQLTLIESFF